MIEFILVGILIIVAWFIIKGFKEGVEEILVKEEEGKQPTLFGINYNILKAVFKAVFYIILFILLFIIVMNM